MNLRKLIEQVRDMQFLLPALFIAFSLLLALGTNELDDRGASLPLLVPSTVRAARTLLATIAGAIITVAALAFSFSAVTVQLAASQYSPRVVHGFLRDRVQQSVVGIVMGTFTYALAGLAALGVDDPGEMSRVDWTASVGVVLAIVAAVAIVAYIDHITRRVRLDDTIKRIADATKSVFADADHDVSIPDESWNLASETESTAVRSEQAGFVQAIDVPRLRSALPPGTIARLDVWSGLFVTEGRRMLTLWAQERPAVPDGVWAAFTIGDARTIYQDPGFGIQQLVDVALRALSTGLNDPATAADCVRQLAGCIRAAILAGDPARVVMISGGGRLVMPHRPSVHDHIQAAFPPIRRNAVDQPIVLAAMVDALDALEEELVAADVDHAALRAEAAAARKALEAIADDD